MDAKKLLEQAQQLLKAAQENPEYFAEMLKKAKYNKQEDNSFTKVKKDDKPHKPNTPEDKAHDVAEEGEKLPEALQEVKGDKTKMFAHLRTLKDNSQHRSEKNRKAGETKKSWKTEASALMSNEKEEVEKCGEMSKEEYKTPKPKYKAPSDQTKNQPVAQHGNTQSKTVNSALGKKPILKSEDLIEKANNTLNTALEKTLIGLGAMMTDPETRKKFLEEAKKIKSKKPEESKEEEEEAEEKSKEKEAKEASKKAESDPCWDSHEMVGMKEKKGKKVPNCVPKKGK